MRVPTMNISVAVSPSAAAILRALQGALDAKDPLEGAIERRALSDLLEISRLATEARVALGIIPIEIIIALRGRGK